VNSSENPLDSYSVAYPELFNIFINI